jgi:DNA-binding NarL/FixJ family response regulator
MSAAIQVLIADDSEVMRRAIRVLLQPESMCITGELASFNELVAMSLWDDAETHSLAESFGAARLLNKSTLATTLVDAIHECMNKAQSASA